MVRRPVTTVILALVAYLVLCLSPGLAAEPEQGLFEAVEQGDRDAVLAAVDKGADVNARNDDSWTPLMVAARESGPSIVRALIDAGAALNETSNLGVTALMVAAQHNEPTVAALLVENGADISASAKLAGEAELEVWEGEKTATAQPKIKHGRAWTRPLKDRGRRLCSRRITTMPRWCGRFSITGPTQR